MRLVLGLRMRLLIEQSENEISPTMVLIVNSLGMRLVCSLGMRLVCSLGMRLVCNLGMRLVYSLGMRLVYSLGMRLVYSLGMRLVYSLGMRLVYSLGMRSVLPSLVCACVSLPHRVFSEKGLPYLEKEFPKIHFKGKGHEVSAQIPASEPLPCDLKFFKAHKIRMQSCVTQYAHA